MWKTCISTLTALCSVRVLYHLFPTVIRFWLCLSIVPSFSDCYQVLAVFEYYKIFFWQVTGCSVWVFTIFFYACWQVLALFEYCTLFFWLVIGFGFVWVLYHHFLTGDSFVLFENCTTFFCWQVLALFEYLTSFSDWWQFLALFEYCTICFWLLAGLGTVWVLYRLFLTGDRFRLCFEYCTIFFWLFSGFGIVWILYYLFLNCDRFCLCLSIVPSFFDWWQGLVRTKFFALFFDFGHVLLPVSFFWQLPGCFVWLLYRLFWLVTDFGTVGEFYLLFLTGDKFWPCLSIVPSFSDWWQVLALFWVLYHIFLFSGFGIVWVLYYLFLNCDRFCLCLSIAQSFFWLWQGLVRPKFLLYSLTCGTFRSSFLFSDCWQVALFDYCTVFFWLVAAFGTVWELRYLFLSGDRFWPCFSIVPSFSNC